MSFRFTLGLAALAALAGTAAAQSDRSLTTPTGWIWLTGASSSTLSTYINQGFRPFDLTRNSSTSFDTIMVANSGVYQKSGWSQYLASTPSALSTSLTNNNQRLLHLEPYDSGSGVNFSAIAIANTGTDAAGWGWLYNASLTDINNWITNNPTPLRLIDLNTYLIGTTRYYSAVAVNNTGAQASGWWWYTNATQADIATHLTQNNARLTNLIVTQNPTASLPTRYACIMVPNSTSWWWYTNTTTAGIADKLDLNAARLVEMERYTDQNNATRFAVVMIDNANALTASVRNVIGAGLSDGVGGGYMKEVGGSVLCSIGADHVFEPASMLKILYGAYAIDRCASSLDNLANSTFVPDRCNPNECPDAVQCNAGSEPLSTTIRGMLENSDNNRTKVVHDRYGRTNLNNFAHNLGMTSTNINHDIGCGLPANQLTLRDAGLLYERIADGTLFTQTWQDTLYDLMIDNVGNTGGFNTEINNQAVGLSLTSSELASFKTLCYMASKGGSYSVNGLEDRTTGGWMRLPFKDGSGNIVYHEYVITSFTNDVNSATEAGNTNSSIWWTMARDRIRAALVTWDSACTPPVINNQPDPIAIVQGGTADFIVGSTGTVTGLTYVWKHNNITVTNGTTAGSTFSGATTSHLHITNLAPAAGGNYQVFLTNGCGNATSSMAQLTVTPPPCGTSDFNGDGDFGTDSDIEAFFACLAGSCCRTCESIDFDGDGDTGTDADIEAFFRVLAGGHC